MVKPPAAPALRGDQLARGSPSVIGKSCQHPANLTAMTWNLAKDLIFAYRALTLIARETCWVS